MSLEVVYTILETERVGLDAKYKDVLEKVKSIPIVMASLSPQKVHSSMQKFVFFIK